MPTPARSRRRVFAGVVLAACLAVLLPALVAPARAAPLDRYWPLARHDLRRTSHSPAKGAIDAPAVRWRHYLGGAMASPRAVDVNLDGFDDILSLEGGRVTVRRPGGQLLWQTAPLGATGLVAVTDVTGDGLDDVVVRSGTAAYVLSLVSGDVLWTTAAGQFPKLSIVSVADFDGDGVRDVAVANASGGGPDKVFGTTFVYRLVGTPSLAAKTAIPSPEVQTPGTSVQASVDVDGDGRLDFVLPGYKHVYAFSGKTGALLGASPELAQMTYYNVDSVAVPATDGGQPWLVVSGDVYDPGIQRGLRGMHVLRLQDGKLVVQWSALVPDQVQDRFWLHRGGAGDLDADGVPEIVSAERVAGVWRLQVRDLATGKLLHEAGPEATWLTGKGGPRPQIVARLGVAGQPVIAIAETQGPVELPFRPLRLLRWTRKDGLQPHADLGVGALSAANLDLPRDDDELAQKPLRNLLPLSADPGVAEVVLTRDTNGDHRPDRVDLVRIDKGATQTVAQATFAGAPQPRIALGTPTGRWLVVEMPDGTCPVLDPKFVTLNDHDGDGTAALVYGTAGNPAISVAPVRDTDSHPVVLVAIADRLLLLDPAGAGPFAPPGVLWQFSSGTALPPGTLADLDGDGTRELLVRHVPMLGPATLSAFTVQGKPLWQYVHPAGPWQWHMAIGPGLAVFDADGDGGEDAYIVHAPSSPTAGKMFSTVIQGKTGLPLWPADAACAGYMLPPAVDMTTKPPRIVLSDYYYRAACHPITGAQTAKSGQVSSSYGVPMLADLDGDGTLDVVAGGAAAALSVELGPGFDVAWKVASSELYHSPATLVPVDGGHLVAMTVEGKPNLLVHDAKTGAQLWTRAYVDGQAFALDAAPASLHTAAGLISVADLTGKGHPTLLFRTTQGYLYAVNALDGSVDWAMDWGGALGDPVVADIDGDDLVEILVTFSDGHLYALDRAIVDPPAWVRENAGEGPAETADEDVDQQEATDRIHANWAPLPSADGYAVRLTDATGGLVVPLLHVGKATAATLADLSLQPGQKYTVSVQAFEAKANEVAYSQPALSDGLTVVDTSPPVIQSFVAVPAAILAGGAEVTELRAHLVDKTRLASWRIGLRPAEGKAEVTVFKGFAATAERDLAEPWSGRDDAGLVLPAGEYVATLRVTDSAGHTAEQTTTVRLCAATEIAEGGKCVLPGVAQPDPGGKTPGVPAIKGKRVQGCGAGPGGLPAGGLALLVAAGLLAVARRRARAGGR